jgi:hypothetical protein
MARQNVPAFLPLLVTLALCMAWPSPAPARLNLPEAEGSAAVEGQDHQVLKEFFSRLGRGETEQLPAGPVRQILLAALPEAYRRGCTEMVARWGEQAAGTAAMSVGVLHVEARGEERPVRALLSYGCFSTAPAYEGKFRDERLASLTVERAASRIVMMPDEKDCEDCSVMTRIVREKDVRIGRRGVVGLGFVKTGENPCCQKDPGRQERVHFYVFDEAGIKRAGSVLKRLEEYAGGAGGERTVYSAAVIFKKDMRGNIVGILSPYRLMKGAGQVDRGMVRYEWDGARLEFLKH